MQAPYLTTLEWTPVGPGGGGAQYNPAIAPNNPDLMLGICDMGALYRSIDGGHDWTMLTPSQAQFPVCYSPVHCRPAFDPFDENILFVGIWDGLKKSTDGGVTWTYARSGNGPTAIAIDRAATNVIFYADNGNRMYRSDDGGTKWAEVASWYSTVNRTVMDIFIDSSTATSNLTLYAATGAGLYKSVNNGATWAASNGDLPSTSISDFNAAMQGGAPVLYVALTSGGIYKSVNAGVNWTAKNNGFAYAAAGHIEIGLCDTNADVVYAGSQENGGPTVYKTTDGGDNWSMVLTDPIGGEFPGGGDGRARLDDAVARVGVGRGTARNRSVSDGPELRGICGRRADVEVGRRRSVVVLLQQPRDGAKLELVAVAWI